MLERDRAVLDAAGDALKGAWVGTPDELRARAEAAAASGITELLYTPSGPDMAREMVPFQPRAPDTTQLGPAAQSSV